MGFCVPSVEKPKTNISWFNLSNDAFVLNRALDRFSSERDKRRVYGLAYLLANLSSATWESARISSDMIKLLMIEILAI